MSKSINLKLILVSLLLVILLPTIIHAQSLGQLFANDAQNPFRSSGQQTGGDYVTNPKTGEQVPSDVQKDNVGTAGNWLKEAILSAMGKGIGFIIYFITYIIGYLGGIAFTFAALFLSFGLRLNTTLIQSQTVNVGWAITRDIANLGFVLAIIFIAISTILGLAQYGMKKNLWRLIVATLLINFSLTFAGILIDASNLMTNFFVAKVIPPTSSASGIFWNNPTSFATNLANAFGVQNALKTNTFETKNYQNLTELGFGMIQLIASLFFVTMFTIAGATVMFLIAALTYIRYIYLTILLILMPLAWLGWVFPGTKLGAAWNDWWNKFIEWLIWLPVATFFIYLTILIVNRQASDPNSITYIAHAIQISSQGGGVLDKFLGLVNNAFETFGRALAILGLLSGGMIAASNLGKHGAKSAIDLAGKAQGWVTGKVSGGTKAVGAYGARRGLQGFLRAGGKAADIDPLTGKPIEGTEKLSYGQRIATGLVKSRTLKAVGLGGAASSLATNLGDYMAKVKGEKGDVAEFRKKLKESSDEVVANQSTNFDNPVNLAGMALELAERGKFSKMIPKEQQGKYLEAIRKLGIEKDFLQNMPHLAEKFGKSIKETTSKIKDITTVSEEAFNDPAFLRHLSNNQMRTLGSSNKVTEDKKEKIKGNIKQAYKNVSSYVFNPGYNPAGQRNVVTDEHRETMKKLQLMQKLTNTPAWSIEKLERELRYQQREAKEVLREQKEEIKEIKENIKESVVPTEKQEMRERVQELKEELKSAKEDVKTEEEKTRKQVEEMKKLFNK